MFRFLAIQMIFLLNSNSILSFNLSPLPNLILKISDFNRTTPFPQTRSSYFGYSIVLRESSIIVGAPRTQSTLATQDDIHEPGAIYKCPLSFDDAAQAANTNFCFPYPVDGEGNYFTDEKLKSEVKDYQLLGASMEGGSKEADPLLVCAPKFVGGKDSRSDFEYLHGICYWIPNTEGVYPNRTQVKKIKSLTNPEKKQIFDAQGRYNWNYQWGEQGFSAHITPKEGEILMGAPGIDFWKGSIVHYDINSGTTTIPTQVNELGYYYTGYAVGSGYLDSENPDKVIYVATAPQTFARQNGLGVAILYDVETGSNAVDKKRILRSHIYGEYFGYAVLVEDINFDNVDDLIVSAPFYSLDGTIDVGAIYVYINQGNFYFEEKLIVSPIKSQAHFGKTLAKLGDINRDGYPDIAVGAPFVDGHGAVAIFLGGPDGLQEKPSQILRMELPIDAVMFGHGLSHGVDIDGNGFNDLAVGAPESEKVFIYRAYPVVYVKTSISPHQSRIELNETYIEVEFCYNFESESVLLQELELHLEIEVDPNLRRITFPENGDNRFALNRNATKLNECQTFAGIIRPSPAFIFIPLELIMKYKIVNDALQYRGETFCTKCAVLDPSSRDISRSGITYIHGCNGAICKANLRIKALEMPSNFTLGLSNTLNVAYIIENLGEKAFDAKVEISTSLNVSHTKIPSNCMKDIWAGNKLLCTLSFGHGFTGNTTLEIGFDMTIIAQVAAMNITASALSSGLEIEPDDNSLNTTVSLNSKAALEVIGQSNDTFVSILEKSHNFDIFYTFKIQNNGPSDLHRLNVWLMVPAAYTNTKNITNNFFNVTLSRASVALKDYYQRPIVNFDTNSSTAEITARARKFIIEEKYLVKAQFLPQHRTLTLNSNDSNTKNMATSLKVEKLEVGRCLTIDLVLNVAPKILKDSLEKRFDYIELIMDLVIEPLHRGHTELNIIKAFQTTIMVDIAPPSTPIWVYIVSTIAGLIVLTLIALAFRKYGFFKRQTKKEMEQLIDEKLQKARMKADLVTAISESDNDESES